MAEAEETYTVQEPQSENPKEAITDIVRQLNVILLRIAEKIADKADA